jgi:hypothetical protein
MLENCCADAEGQAIVLTKVGVHLARVLASDLMYLAWAIDNGAGLVWFVVET